MCLLHLFLCNANVMLVYFYTHVHKVSLWSNFNSDMSYVITIHNMWLIRPCSEVSIVAVCQLTLVEHETVTSCSLSCSNHISIVTTNEEVVQLQFRYLFSEQWPQADEEEQYASFSVDMINSNQNYQLTVEKVLAT